MNYHTRHGLVITFYYFCRRRVAGVVERGGLENRCTLASTKGSNPLPSALITYLIPNHCKPLC